MAVVRDLRVLLRFGNFRRLLAVRLLSQGADGVYQVALATYVVFSPEKQTSAAAIASAMAVLLLPYSLVGPFAGVLLDRWRRRQVFLYGNLLRAVLAAADGRPDAERRAGLALLRLRAVRDRGQPVRPGGPVRRAAPRRRLRAPGDGQLPVAHGRNARRDRRRRTRLRRTAGRLGLRRGGRPRRSGPLPVRRARLAATGTGTSGPRP